MTDLIKNLLNSLTLNAIAETDHKFANVRLEEELFDYTWRLSATLDCLSPPFISYIKSDMEADKLRNEGTANFMKKRFEFAFELVNASLRKAPHPLLDKDGVDILVGEEGAPEPLLKDNDNSSSLLDAKGEHTSNSLPSKEGTLLHTDSPPMLDEERKMEESITAESEDTKIETNTKNNLPPGRSETQNEKEAAKSSIENVDKKKDEGVLQQYLALARGYGNRSAILFHMELYHECLKDIDRAMKYSQEEAFVTKLLERKKNCLEAIQKEGKIEKTRKFPSQPKMETCNLRHPSLSDAVRVDYADGVGRHLVAKKDLRPGDLIMMEKGHWETLQPSYITKNCSNCFMFCPQLVPCPGCSWVVFCNEECRAEAMAKFHSRECPILPSLFALKPEMPAMLASRIVMKVSYSTLKEVMPQVLKDLREGRKGGGESEGSFDPSLFRSLIFYDNKTERPSDGLLFTYCLWAVIVTKLLQDSGNFFVDGDGQAFQPSEDDLKLTGTTLFRLMIIVLTRSNSFIFNPRIHGGSEMGNIFSSGVCPTVCMAKKSCNPSAALYKSGPTFMMRVTLPIPAGDSITTSGSVHFCKSNPRERKKEHAHLGINCNCVACEENWPIYADLPEGFRLKCPKCSHPLNRMVEGRVRCDHHIVDSQRADGDSCWAGISRGFQRLLGRRQVGEDMDEMKELYALVDRLLERKNLIKVGEETENDRQLMIKVIEILHNHAVLPCKNYTDFQDLLLKCYFVRESLLKIS